MVTPRPPAVRRRGAELERAILDAALDQPGTQRTSDVAETTDQAMLPLLAPRTG